MRFRNRCMKYWQGDAGQKIHVDGNAAVWNAGKKRIALSGAGDRVANGNIRKNAATIQESMYSIRVLEDIEEVFKENTENIEDANGVHHFVIDSFTARFLAKEIIHDCGFRFCSEIRNGKN